MRGPRSATPGTSVPPGLRFLLAVLERKVPSPTKSVFIRETGMHPFDPRSGRDICAELAELRNATLWRSVGIQEQPSTWRCRALLTGVTDHRTLLMTLSFEDQEKLNISFRIEYLSPPLTPWSAIPRVAMKQNVNPSIDRITSRVRDDEQVVGLVCAISRDGRLIHESCAGFETLTGDKLIDSRTIFRAGSVSKIVTAMGVLKLATEGEIAIDEPVHRFLHSVEIVQSRSVPRITPRHLLNHVAGLVRTAPIADAVVSAGVPGQIRNYSNLGYNLLARVIQDVSGVKYADWTKANIFAPLGMADSRIEAYREGMTGYDRGFDIVWPASQPVLDDGARGLTTSCRDLGLLMSAVADAPNMCEPQIIAGARDLNRGLGLILNYRGGRWIGFHDGGVRNSWHTYAGFDLLTRTVVTSVANSHPIPIVELSETVLGEFLSSR